MRNLTEVIDAMLIHVPPNAEDLITDLNSIKESAEFCPPEMMRLWWSRAQEALGDNLPHDVNLMNEWQHKVFAVWMKRP